MNDDKTLSKEVGQPWSRSGPDSVFIIGRDGVLIAEVNDRRSGWREIACLIAATTDLHEALQEMYDSACGHYGSTPSKAAFLKTIAALAKARSPS